MNSVHKNRAPILFERSRKEPKWFDTSTVWPLGLPPPQHRNIATELIGAPCQERGRCITGDLCKPHTHTHTHTTLQHPQPKTLQLLSVLSHSTCLALNKATIGQGISVCYCCDVSVHSAQAATRLLGWDPCHPMAQGSSRRGVSQRRVEALKVAFLTRGAVVPI